MSSVSTNAGSNLVQNLNLTVSSIGDTSVIKINCSVAGEKSSKRVILVLDVSGSMAGSPINSAVVGIENLIKNLRTDDKQQRIDLLTYSDRASLIELPFDADELRRILLRIHAGGGTVFANAFELLRKRISTLDTPAAVVFFTDGMDSTGDKNTIERMALSVAAACQQKKVEFHSIGVGSEHDAVLLNRIIRIGTLPGTFQYVHGNGVTMQDAIGNLHAKLCGTNVTVRFNLSTDYSCVLETADGITYSGRVVVKRHARDIPSTITVNVSVGSRVSMTKVDMPLVDLSPSEFADIQLDAVDAELKTLIGRLETVVNQRDPKTTASVGVRVKEIDELVDNLHAEYRKFPSTVRKQILPRVLELKQTIAQLVHGVASAHIGNLSAGKFAELNALAHRAGIKASTQKKLDQRMITNTELFKRVDGQIATAVSKIKFDELKLESAIVPVDACALSTNNWIELLRDHDCLCIGLSVTRPEGAVHDPSLVQIREIYPTFLSAEQFLEAVQYTVGHNPSAATFGKPQTASGGIVTGVAREPITGVLPLFICPEHWSVANLKMKQILGWLATLDPLGYSYAQVKTIPFAVLAKALSDMQRNPSDHKQRILTHVTAVCRAIFSSAHTTTIIGDDGKPIEKWTEQVIGVFNNYVVDPAARTVDVVPNNYIFLAQIYTAIALDLIKPAPEYARQISNLIYEEQLRRLINVRLVAADPSEFKKLLREIIVVPERFHVPHIAAYEKEIKTSRARELAAGSDQYSVRFRQSLAIKKPAGTPAAGLSATDIPVSPAAINPVAGDKIHLENICDWLSEPSHVHEMVNVKKLDTVMDTEDLLSRTCQLNLILRAIGFVTIDLTFPVTTVNAIMFQNLLGRSNTHRRDYVSAGLYVNPFTDTNSVFVREAVKICTELISEGKNAIASRVNSDAFAGNALLFGDTENLHTAAGILMSVKLGVDFMYYVHQLQTRKCPHAFEKIRMLVKGKWESVQLIPDMPKMEGYRWSPSSHNVHQLWLTNRTTITREQWMSLFPKLEHKISSWYQIYGDK